MLLLLSLNHIAEAFDKVGDGIEEGRCALAQIAVQLVHNGYACQATIIDRGCPHGCDSPWRQMPARAVSCLLLFSRVLSTRQMPAKTVSCLVRVSRVQSTR